MILKFITIVAWIAWVLSLIRSISLFFADHRHPLIVVAEMLGENPVGDAIWRSGILFLISSAWLLTYYTTK